MAHDASANLPRATASDSPFQTRLFPSRLTSLSTTPNDCTTASRESRSWEQFPASFRTGPSRNDIHVVDGNTLSRFLEVEFSLERLDCIASKLWRAGYPRPPRSLTTQIQMGRTIVLTDALDMHLVWGGGKIFLKPLPRYLLEPEFWTSNLPPGAPTGDGQVADLITGGKISATRQGVSASTRVPMALYGSPPLPRPGIRESALGLLYTYACLIAHPVDLKLALEQGLIPKDGQNEPDWATWRKLAAELLQPKISRQVHRRFWRGELRLGRLNWIYVFRDMPSFQMYHNLWHSYTDFFAANVSWVATSTIYGAIVLTAMQVGLSTDALKDNVAFQQASYGFTVFAILGPIIIVSLVLVVLIIVLIPNWINTRSAERQLEPPWPTTTMTSVEIA